MEKPVVTNRHEIRHVGQLGTSAALVGAIDTLVEDPIIAITAVKLIGAGGHDRLICGWNAWQLVGDELKRVIAVFSEKQVTCLLVETSADHIVPRAAEDPVFTGTARQGVVPILAQDYVLANRRLRETQVHLLRYLVRLELEMQAIDANHPRIRLRLDLQYVRPPDTK